MSKVRALADFLGKNGYKVGEVTEPDELEDGEVDLGDGTFGDGLFVQVGCDYDDLRQLAV